MHHLRSEHLVLLLQRSHPSLQLFDLEIAAGVAASAARELTLQGTLGGDGFLQRQLETDDTHRKSGNTRTHTKPEPYRP